jgi:hypothetical protein
MRLLGRAKVFGPLSMITGLALVAGALLTPGCSSSSSGGGATDSGAGDAVASEAGGDGGSQVDAGSVTANVGTQTKSDKIDLLLAIDNSASMGDKQAALSAAVPDLLTRLITPNCVDASGKPTGTVADPSKPAGSQCATGTPEFTPVKDIHVGIVSSSLGAFGDATVCADTAPSNDHGQLVNRTMIADAAAGFLAWAPGGGAGSVTDAATLTKDFQGIVVGAGQNGCGLEAQLESWYHFLIQPDPWAKISIDSSNLAKYSGVDATILKQRHDFLRPDSLVAVVLLTDEDDSFADPLSIGGEGWAYSVSSFPGSTVTRTGGGGTTAPMGTTMCATNPADPACTSCGFAASCNASDPACQALKNDANCKSGGGDYAADSDSLNTRFFHMKSRYGVDPQYPISRYVRGLGGAVGATQGSVPKGPEEHNAAGVYQPNAASCQNPLFAAALPASVGDELCNLKVGPRNPSMVYFAIIGGVPNELLHFDPTSPAASRLVAADWTKILGNAPENYDYSGIDPHMIQSIAARAGLAAPSSTPGDNGMDTINGREWDTKKVDLQYACTFPLDPTSYVTCAAAGDASCGDCNGLSTPPLCDVNPLKQIRAKAYPTVRELQVAKGLGDQAITASICARTVGLQGQSPEPESTGGAPNPLYAYRPATKSIVDSMKASLK